MIYNSKSAVLLQSVMADVAKRNPDAPIFTEQRPLNVIAREISRAWVNVYFGAVPYLDAMGSLDNVRENYGEDSAKSIVLYFLSNATGWRGPDAKRIKAELKKLVGVK
jgi:hypothetical protein